jgi:methionyl-tRNA formyltransferase
MKIVFMGTPDYATEIFKEIMRYKDMNIIALFTQPDKPVGRKKIITPPHIKQYCLDNDIDISIFQPKTLRDEEITTQIKELNPDFIVVAAYGQILPQSILDIAPCINLHASLLPKYRGASPIQQSILNDDIYTGVTSMLMEAGLDSGDILGYRYVKIDDKDVGVLFDELAVEASKLTIDTLRNFSLIKPIKQNSSEVSHCKKITKEDGLIELKNAKNVDIKYRAYKYWPEIYLQSKLKLKELNIDELDSQNIVGEIKEIGKDYAIIGCEIGSIKLSIVQPNSKKAMNVADYIRGKRLEVGDILE